MAARILYLEDSVFQFRLVNQWLLGVHELVQAASIADARKLIEKSLGPGGKKFTLFICDYFLPDGTCLDFVRQLRRVPRYKNVPAILISKALDDDMLRRAIDAGINDCVRKPVRPVEFLSLIDRMLSDPYVRRLDFKTVVLTCLAWREETGYFQYSPHFCKQVEGASANETSEKMRQFLSRRLKDSEVVPNLEDVSLARHSFEQSGNM